MTFPISEPIQARTSGEARRMGWIMVTAIITAVMQV